MLCSPLKCVPASIMVQGLTAMLLRGTGMQVVFHCATAAPVVQNTSARAVMQAVNVAGTRNVIDACIKHGVAKLVYTSSSSVVFEGRDLVDVDESIPLATRPIDFYAATKVWRPP